MRATRRSTPAHVVLVALDTGPDAVVVPVDAHADRGPLRRGDLALPNAPIHRRDTTTGEGTWTRTYPPCHRKDSTPTRPVGEGKEIRNVRVRLQETTTPYRLPLLLNVFSSPRVRLVRSQSVSVTLSLDFTPPPVSPLDVQVHVGSAPRVPGTTTEVSRPSNLPHPHLRRGDHRRGTERLLRLPLLLPVSPTSSESPRVNVPYTVTEDLSGTRDGGDVRTSVVTHGDPTQDLPGDARDQGTCTLGQTHDPDTRTGGPWRCGPGTGRCETVGVPSDSLGKFTFNLVGRPESWGGGGGGRRGRLGPLRRKLRLSFGVANLTGLPTAVDCPNGRRQRERSAVGVTEASRRWSGVGLRHAKRTGPPGGVWS